MRIPETLAELAVPIAGLKPYPKNPRRGNIDVIVESLRTSGQYKPITVNRRGNVILAGNHTFEAAKQLGWTEIAATFVDVDDTAAKVIVAIDNRSNDLAGYDDQALADMLQSLDGNLAGTGFTEEELLELLASIGPNERELADPDDVPKPPKTPKTKTGQTWLLGDHRLTVGDAIDPTVVAAALGGAPAQLVVTDPPYNVDYTGKTDDALQIDNDDMASDAFRLFLADAMTTAIGHAKKGAPLYLFYASHEAVAVAQAIEDAGWLHKQQLVWIKHHFVMSRQDYHWQHELILYGWKPGATHPWHGGFTPTTVVDDAKPPSEMTKAELREIVDKLYATTTTLRADRPARSADHPTSKPIALLTRMIENSSAPGDLVLDPFGGSGSTLIAADYVFRRCAIVEIDPRYADVICRRYQEYAGTKPILEQTGEPHDFT